MECDSPGFIPSSPYIGADEGWDGRYQGHYSKEGKDGVWSIQSKWTTKSFKDAIPHLEEEIKKELENAAAKQVNHLRIATNAELKVEQVLRLQDLAKDTAISLLVWHREDLTQRIAMQPFLRHLFFGDPQFPKLVPWNRYFSEYERDLLPMSETRIESFEDYVHKAKDFLLSATANVLLISSPGGYGKSHLLRSIAQIAHEVDRRTQVWVIRGGVRTIQDAMQNEIVAGRRCLLIFDDADRFMDEIKPLLSFLRASNSIKVILALRTSGHESVFGNVAETRLGTSCEEIRISDWNKGDLTALLRAAAKREAVEDESTIVAQYPNPFLIVWIGRQISGKSDVPLDSVKRYFVDDMDRETRVCLGAAAEDLLVNLACVVPVSLVSDKAFATMASTLNEERIREKIDRLVEAGILRVVGRNLRFNPDMKGDLYLADKLDASEGRLGALLGTWLQICPERLLSNVASAARFANSPSIGETLSRITRPWMKGNILPFRSRKEVLDVIVRLVAIVPEQCIDVIDAFVQSNEKLTTDDYGPAISGLVGITTLRDRVLKTIVAVHTKGIQGSYDNYRPQSLIRLCASPLHNSIQTIGETLKIANQWLNEPDRTHMELLSAALCEVLAGTHEYNKYGILTVEFGEKALRDTPEVRELRQRAIGLLELMIGHSSVDVNLAAIAVAEKIGSMRTRSRDEDTLPLSVEIREERRLVTRRIGGLLSPRLHFMLMNKIEQLFLTWWAQRIPGTDEAERYLQNVPRNAEYITFSHYASSEFVVENFAELKSKAPTQGRWEWFVHTRMSRFDRSEDDFTELVSTLNQSFNSPQEVVQLLVRIDHAILISERRPSPPIVTRWVKINPPLFSAIQESNALWQQVPEPFKNEILGARAEVNDAALFALAQEVLSKLPDTQITKAQLFLSSLGRHPIKQNVAFSRLARTLDRVESENTALLGFDMLRILNRVTRVFSRGPVTPMTVYEWFAILLTKGNSVIRATALLHLCPNVDKLESTYLLVRLTRLAVSKKMVLSDAMIRSLHILILNKGERIRAFPSKTVACLRQELLDSLKHTARLDHEAQSLVEFASNQEIDTLIGFVESRIQISLGTNASEYQAIPFGGFGFLARMIISFDDYERLVSRTESWHQRGYIWRYHLKVLMEELCETAEVKPYAQEYVEKQLEKQNIEAALAGCGYLPLDVATFNVFVRVGARAISCGKKVEIESLLHDATLPREAYVSLPGEPPRQLVERKELFLQMHLDANPMELNAILDDCIERIDEAIEMGLRMDDDISNPRP